MPSIGDTTRPEYIYDQATDTWIPVGIGPHAHTPAAIGAIASSVVTTKGDIIAATGSGVVVRQGVGADGSYLMADSSQADGLSYASGASLAAGKNGILNGAFDVWQRGTSVSVAATVFGYTADRWLTNQQSVITVSRQPVGDTTNLPNILYCARYQRNAGQTSTTVVQLTQPFENINSTPFVGQTVTVSFYARRGANFSSSGNVLNFQLYSGTGFDQNLLSSYTGAATPINTSFTLTTTWQRFTATGTISASATEIAPYFFYSPTGTAGANDYYEITGVQLELGSVATPFARNNSTYQGELAACQRYYYRLGAGGGGNTSGVQFGYYFDATASSSTNLWGVLPLPVTMRKTPSSVDYFNVGWIVTWGAGVNAISVITVYDGSNVVGSNPQSVIFQMTTTGATTNTRYPVLSNNTTAGYIGVSAEL
jgi:hypothetical protein